MWQGLILAPQTVSSHLGGLGVCHVLLPGVSLSEVMSHVGVSQFVSYVSVYQPCHV